MRPVERYNSNYEEVLLMARTVITRSTISQNLKTPCREWVDILKPIVKTNKKKACLGAFKQTDAALNYTATEKSYNRIVESIHSNTEIHVTLKDALTFIRMFHRMHYKKELQISNSRHMMLLQKLSHDNIFDRELTGYEICCKYVEWTYYYDKFKTGEYKDREFNPVLLRQSWMIEKLNAHEQLDTNRSFI